LVPYDGFNLYTGNGYMNALIRTVKQWWAAQDHAWQDPLIEGWYADQYPDTATQQRIRQEYQQRWCSEPTPATKPELFDPLAPPAGWRYDPYYEIWTQQ
jgi:hypothetical protein